MVLAALSTAASLPWNGCPFLAVASVFSAAGFLVAACLLVVWAWSCAGATATAAASRVISPNFRIEFRILMVICWLVVPITLAIPTTQDKTSKGFFSYGARPRTHSGQPRYLAKP